MFNKLLIRPQAKQWPAIQTKTNGAKASRSTNPYQIQPVPDIKLNSGQLPELDAVRRYPPAPHALAVLLIVTVVPLKPGHLAVSLKGQNVGGDPEDNNSSKVSNCYYIKKQNSEQYSMDNAHYLSIECGWQP
jgi:hypothetical protein